MYPVSGILELDSATRILTMVLLYLEDSIWRDFGFHDPTQILVKFHYRG
jgi:hypothetical protein